MEDGSQMTGEVAGPQTAQEGRTYSIGDLSREFGVTTRALRFYESHGLLDPRRVGQRRIYSRRDRTRLKLTMRGKRLGMTLAEIRELFDLYDEAHGEQRQMQRYLDILAERRRALEQQRRDVDEALAELAESEQECRRILARQRSAGRDQ